MLGNSVLCVYVCVGRGHTTLSHRFAKLTAHSHAANKKEHSRCFHWLWKRTGSRGQQAAASKHDLIGVHPTEPSRATVKGTQTIGYCNRTGGCDVCEKCHVLAHTVDLLLLSLLLQTFELLLRELGCNPSCDHNGQQESRMNQRCMHASMTGLYRTIDKVQRLYRTSWVRRAEIDPCR